MVRKHIKCQMDNICRVPHFDGECKRNCIFNTIEVPTNADLIRAMTDEELANSITDDLCDRVCHSPLSCDGNCETQVLAWLKQEVDND